LYGASGLNRSSLAPRLASVVLVGVGLSLGALWMVSNPACAVYDPSLLLPGDAGDGGRADVDLCQHAGPPPRPALDAGAGASGNIEVVAAFDSIDIGLETEAGAPRPPVGFDLDGVCTCPGPPSCRAQAGTDPTQACDPPDNSGRDNVSIDLFRALGSVSSAGTQQIDQGLQTGQYGLLLDIRDYNGTPDDPAVKVSFYVSNGVNRGGDGGLQLNPNGPSAWTIDPGSLRNNPDNIPSCAANPACQPLFEDDSAYVKDSVVVANFTQIPVAFGDRSFLGGATMQLTGAIIVGQLQPVSIGAGGGFSYKLAGGTIAGRWPTSQLLATLATIPDPSADGSFFCGPNSITYNLIKAVACQAADITSSQNNDNKNASCDAVSVGMRFTAVPALLGSTLSIPAAPAGCSANGVPFQDSCQQ
jgi:hypothetical protein